MWLSYRGTIASQLKEMKHTAVRCVGFARILRRGFKPYAYSGQSARRASTAGEVSGLGAAWLSCRNPEREN